MEALTLTLTEVVKRQNPKSKKGFNQVRACFSHLPPSALAGVMGKWPVLLVREKQRKDCWEGRGR